MSAFEYLVSFLSILVGLAIADLTVSLHRLLRCRRRVRWDWLPLAAALIALLLVLQFWWKAYGWDASVWRFYAVYGAFLLLAAILVVMFLLTATALPDEVPAEGLDLRSYYEENHGYFWGLFTLFMLLTVASQLAPLVALERPGARVGPAVLLLSVLPNLVVAALLLTLSFVRSRAYHSVLVPLMLVFLGWHWFGLRLG